MILGPAVVEETVRRQGRFVHLPDYFFLPCALFFISRSTSEQSCFPRVQTTVPSPRGGFSESGITHLISSAFGQGQSVGFGTQSSVCGHKYWGHDTGL